MQLVESVVAASAILIASASAQTPGCTLTAPPFEGMSGVIPNAHAKNFQLSVTGPYTATLTILGSQKLDLIACNAPSATSSASNAVTIPVSSISVNQNAVTGFIERLGKISAISSAQKQFATSECAQTIPANASAPATVTFGSGAVDVTAAVMSEASPLAMAEWILFFDTLFAMQSNGKTVYSGIVSQYQCLANKIAAYRQNTTAKYGSDPIVLITAVDLSSNTFVAPVNQPYWTAILSDAGGVPLVAQDTATFLTMAHNADVVFDTTVEKSTDFNIQLWNKITGLNPKTPGYPFLNGFSSEIWRFDRRVGNGADDFYQSAPAQPDLLLADLIEIFDSAFHTGFASYWLRNLANTAGYSTISASQCPSRSAFTQYQNGTLCPTNAYIPDVGRLNNPGNLLTPPTVNNGSDAATNVSTGTAVGGIVGGIVGGVLVGLLCVFGAVWAIGRKRARAGVDEAGRGAFAWVKDAAANRRFMRFEDGESVRMDDAAEAGSA
ncbi:hypothetical protein BC830DRAFT_1155597 [Chytriomyces sp. MP71]|nr:hypothetical protein BC830DRAFT_1155597 [Chytriomyces sp. MP71]